MADNEVRQHSVTKDDVGNRWSNVQYWYLGHAGTPKLSLPPYWSRERDYHLRQIIYEDFHDFWSGAIGIAITKISSLGWDLESDDTNLRDTFQELLLAADDNQSWVRFVARHMQDFLGCDNGAFIEMVRATQGAGSRMLGLMHLDSVRCTRTGDPEIPILYSDTKGKVHEVKAHQVLTFVDMPSPSETYHGVGFCATSRAWGAIKKMEAIERYIYEKISGDRALAVDILGGVLPKHVEEAVLTAQEQNEARGNSSYLGAILVPVPTDNPITHTRINFAELPDGFNYQEQVNSCILTFANAIGLDVQDLQPLTGRPLGTATQSQVLEDKSAGKGLAAWRQQFTHLINQYLLPDVVVFAFSEKDLRDQQRQADVDKTNADLVGTLVEKKIISPSQAQQMLADRDVIPQEFVPEDVTPVEAIADSEKPAVEDAAQENADQAPPEEQGPPPPEEQVPPIEEATKQGRKGRPSDEEAQRGDNGAPFQEMTKSVSSVARRFQSDMRGLATLGFISSSSILGDTRRLVKDAVSDAYIEGLKEGGITEDEMTEDDAMMIVELAEEQSSYVTDFCRAVRDAQGDTREAKQAQRDILDNRIPLWTQSIEGCGMKGLASAQANEMVTWHLGATEEHCRTCNSLDGKSHRRKWFSDRNYYPRTPGAALECGGFNCQCTLE